MKADSPLLIPEPPLQVLPSLAAGIGVNEAIFLQQIHYWSLGKMQRGEEPSVYNTQEDWVKQMPWLTLRTLQRVIDRLREKDLIEIRQPEGTNRRSHYLIKYDNLPCSEAAKVAASSRQNGGLTSTSSKKSSKNQKSESKKTVGRKIVTDDELTLAAAVVLQFNSSAGTALSVDAHLTPIVGRIRERPDYTEAHHRKIIEAVFAGDHWWTGPPTPKIIYGNAGIFEQSIELAKARAKQGQREENPNAERERVRREFEEAESADQ